MATRTSSSSSSSSATSIKIRSPTCLCSPSNHPGSFRCSSHNNRPNRNESASASTEAGSSSSATSIKTRSSTCPCSPTNRPWWVRCSLQRNQSNRNESAPALRATSSSSPSSSVHSFKTRSPTCLCSPTTNHPWPFHCSLHKNQSNRRELVRAPKPKAFTLKAFLRRMIKPPRRDETRRMNFRPTPSRFFTMHGSVAVS